jgi:hypothetical protein
MFRKTLRSNRLFDEDLVVIQEWERELKLKIF